MRIPKSFDETILDEVAIVVLSLVSVGLLVVEVVGSTSPAQGLLLERIDFGIALIFLAEFLYSIVRAPDRRRFLRKRWWEIFATGGRIIAIFLMLTGIGTLGLYTAAIASWVLKQKE